MRERAGPLGRLAWLGLLLVGLGLGAVLWLWPGPPGAGPEPTSGPLETAPTTGPVDTAGRLVVPVVGLDVPLGAMLVEDGLIDPPGTSQAYLLANHGVGPQAAAVGTVFVALHALSDGTGPGNRLADPTARTATVGTGDRIGLDGVWYVVQETAVRSQTDIARDAALWRPDQPDRLILLTCLDAPASPSGWDNLIIVATRVE
jgi:hypothetical protein